MDGTRHSTFPNNPQFVSAHKLRRLLLAFGAAADLVMGENPNRNAVYQPVDEIEFGAMRHKHA
jgi:hypothetical protein